MFLLIEWKRHVPRTRPAGKTLLASTRFYKLLQRFNESGQRVQRLDAFTQKNFNFMDDTPAMLWQSQIEFKNATTFIYNHSG